METLGTSIGVVYEEGVFKPQEPVPASGKPHRVLPLHVPAEDEATAVSDGDDDATGWNNLMEADCLQDKDGSTDASRNHDK